MKEPNDDLIKRLEEEMNNRAGMLTSNGTDRIKRKAVLQFIQNKDIDKLSEEFTKMLCDLAMDIITFAPLGTFADLLHDVYQNQKRCSGITPEELDQLEREESNGVDCAISWIMGSFYKRNQIKPSDDRDEVLLHGLSVCVNKYIQSVRLIPKDDVDDIEIPKKGDQDD